MSQLRSTRRQFVQTLPALVGLSVLATAGLQANAEERRRPKKDAGGAAAGGMPLVDPATDPMAKSVNYVHAHADLKKAELKTERQGVKWDEQFCKGCQLKVDIPGKTDVVGCTLFAGKSVKANGWCSSWAKKS